VVSADNNHVLHKFPPPQSEAFEHCDLHQRRHNFSLPARTDNFIQRVLYHDVYWRCTFTSVQLRSTFYMMLRFVGSLINTHDDDASHEQCAVQSTRCHSRYWYGSTAYFSTAHIDAQTNIFPGLYSPFKVVQINKHTYTNKWTKIHKVHKIEYTTHINYALSKEWESNHEPKLKLESEQVSDRQSWTKHFLISKMYQVWLTYSLKMFTIEFTNVKALDLALVNTN